MTVQRSDDEVVSEALTQTRLDILMRGVDALRDAQLWMLREARRVQPDKTRGLEELVEHHPPDKEDRLPPYYWAAFVLSGDWR